MFILWFFCPKCIWYCHNEAAASENKRMNEFLHIPWRDITHKWCRVWDELHFIPHLWLQQSAVYSYIIGDCFRKHEKRGNSKLFVFPLAADQRLIKVRKSAKAQTWFSSWGGKNMSCLVVFSIADLSFCVSLFKGVHLLWWQRQCTGNVLCPPGRYHKSWSAVVNLFRDSPHSWCLLAMNFPCRTELLLRCFFFFSTLAEIDKPS